jgi:hypothetical protein
VWKRPSPSGGSTAARGAFCARSSTRCRIPTNWCAGSPQNVSDAAEALPALETALTLPYATRLMRMGIETAMERIR